MKLYRVLTQFLIHNNAKLVLCVGWIQICWWSKGNIEGGDQCQRRGEGRGAMPGKGRTTVETWKCWNPDNARRMGAFRIVWAQVMME